MGGDGQKHRVVFTLLGRDWSSDRPIMAPIPIKFEAISPDATKVAFSTYQHVRSDNPPRLLYIVYDDGFGWNEVTIGTLDCVFGFSPDGLQLAISNQKSVRRNEEEGIDIQILKNIGGRGTRIQKRVVTIHCDEKLDGAPKHGFLSDIQEIFSPLKPLGSSLWFTTWKYHWVAALWKESGRILALYDLHSESSLVSFDLSCFNVLGSQIRDTRYYHIRQSGVGGQSQEPW